MFSKLLTKILIVVFGILLPLTPPLTIGEDIVEDSISIYPRSSETRYIQSLDGVWNFRLAANHTVNGFAEKWYEKQLDSWNDHERMPVPASFNDITQHRSIRDHNGWVWYDRKFFILPNWQPQQSAILLRFGSVHYQGVVYVNGRQVANHTGGHIPFQADISGVVKRGTANHLTVAVNNELSPHTLPPGSVVQKKYTRTGDPNTNTTFTETKPSFDFFNYAGIHREVTLAYVPVVRIVDFTVITDVISSSISSSSISGKSIKSSKSYQKNNELSTKTSGEIRYKVITNVRNETEKDRYKIELTLTDKNGTVVHKTTGADGKITIVNANLWWPFGMSATTTPGYQYTITVRLWHIATNTNTNTLVDSIEQKVGIRKISYNTNTLMVNGKPLYLRGFGRHEDQNIRGRSLDLSMVLKDFNLMKWIGANSFRTSHYPYSEVIMDEADEQGFVVINEVPAVGLSQFNDEMLRLHLYAVQQLIERDKNRPSVFAWSIANEPTSSKPESKAYFAKVANEARRLDPSKRPITGAIAVGYAQDHMAPSLDLLMINRYYGWYSDTGYPQVIQGGIVYDITKWYERFQKPVMMSEYGADTVSGLHSAPSFVFSEDYQIELMIEYHRAFDALRSKGFFFGEHIWNFADFMTIQQTTRVGGNKKGIFTREREPKGAARLLRCRYWALSGDATNRHREGYSLCPKVIY